MNNKTSRPAKERFFNIAQSVDSIKKNFMQLKSTQPPGLPTKGNKTQILELLKDDIEELMREGYTTQQIAETVSKTFSVLPKTITQVITGKTVKRRKKIKTAIKANKNESLPPKAQAVHANSQVKDSEPTRREQGRTRQVTEISDVE